MTYGEPARGQPRWTLKEESSRPLIKHALDAGINFFDTANIYSDGSSEEILGRALRDFADRDDVVIATKLRHAMRPGPNAAGLSRKVIMAEVDRSLRRLETDYIDLYQIHRNDPRTPLEETLEALHDVVKAGKVRYLGASSMRAWEFAKALHLQRRHGWSRFSSMQHHYNLIAREEENEMIPLCIDEGIGTLIWSPLAGGRLARPWSELNETARARTDAGYTDVLYSPMTADSDRRIIEALGDIAAARGVPRAQIALAWLLSKRVVSAPILGANTPTQIDDAIASLHIELTTEEVRSLEYAYTPRHDFQSLFDEEDVKNTLRRMPGAQTFT
jgi:aryl-alcohol dehydrogenase-like predicted oxidoreductase